LQTTTTLHQARLPPSALAGPAEPRAPITPPLLPEEGFRAQEVDDEGTSEAALLRLRARLRATLAAPFPIPNTKKSVI
jgi:hypothetical protein